MPENSPPHTTVPPIYLPGLKLRTVNKELEPSTVLKVLADALDSGHKDVVIFLKHFDPSLFKLFPGQEEELSLAVMYTGGIGDEPALIDDYEVEESDAGGGKDDEDALLVDIFDAGTEGEEEEGVEEVESVELDLITVDYKHTASPVDGYYCFHLRVEDDWSSPDKMMKTLETIEVSVAVHGGEGEENPAGVSDDEMTIFDFGNVKTRHGSMVGESFVIDLLALEQTDSKKGKEDSAKVFFLDWNWSDVLMRQVFSPQELQSFDNEKLIPQEILFLGAADNKQYNPLKDLKLHVNLFGFEGRHKDLVIKIYNVVDFKFSLKKSATNALEDAMKGATDQLDLVPSTISANVEGWVTFEFGVKNILLSFLARYATEFPHLASMSTADFEHILDPDSHKSDEEERLSSIIIHIITSIRLSVVVEDSSSGTPLSKFLLDAIESNDIYYDSAVKLLQNSDNWVEEKLIKWSTMATFSSLTDLNCLYRFAQFKLSEKESIPLVDISSENRHTFEVTVNLPNLEVDPNTLCLLVHHSNGMLHFQNEDPSHKFKYLTTPTIGADGNDSVTFKWISTNPTKAAGEVDLTISLLIAPDLVFQEGEEPSRENHKKIGSSVSFAKQIAGHTSEKHFASLRIRRSIALGIEEVSPLEESVSNFLESFFQVVLKISGLEDFISRSELENSSDEIGTAFYAIMLQQDYSMMWSEIMTSSVFQSNPIDPDYDEGQNNTETAEVLMTMFDALLIAYSGSLRNVIRIILDEKGLKETDENYEQEFESFRGKFSAVFQLSIENLASDLVRFPTTKANFISAGRILSEEIEEFTNSTSTESEDASYSTFSRSSNLTGTSSVDSAYEVLVDSGLKMDRRDFERVIHNPIQALDQQSRHVSREIAGRMTPHLFNLSSVPVSATSRAAKMTSMAATMEDKLTRMLNSAEDAGSDVTSVLETTQNAIEDILSPIDGLDEFRSIFSSLANQAISLERAIRTMIPIILTIGNRCPLWPVKALVNIIKSPLNMLKKAAKRGKDTIVRLNNNLSRQLRTILNMRSKISSSTGKLDAPKGAIEKFQEIISMLSTLAASGLLPVNIISKFIESTTLESFFDVLKSNTKSMKDLLESCNREIQKVSRYFPSIRSLLNSIRQKFNVMRPIDNIFRKIKPYVDKAVALFNRTFSWWTRWLFAVILKPIEWGINFILRPFKNTIRRMVEKINPFGGIGFLQTIGNGIGGVISQLNGIDSKILDIVSFNSIPGFHNTAGILADGLAIVLRAMYTLLSQAIEQGANNIEFLEDMISGSDAMDSVMKLLLKEKSSNESVTLSTILLEMKAQSIDGPSARIDTYLKNNVSSNPFTYNDYSSGMINKFINWDTSYDLVPCFLSPVDDAKTPYFERANYFSWLTAPLSGILHHKLLIEHAKSLQLNCDDFTKLSDVFVPQISADGKCTIQLFNTFRDVQASPTYIDTRLPVKKASLALPNDVTNIAANLVNFISKKVFSPIHESFSLAQRGSCSWALLEKVVICKGAIKSETIGSGVHLLTGLKEAVYYLRDRQTNSFDAWDVSLSGAGFRTSSHHFNEAQQAPMPDNAMIAHMRNCTLSMGQINILKSAGQSLEDIDETKKSEIFEQMKNLKMFIVRDYNGVDHPIICHDETDQKNILFSTGVLLQPLIELPASIWEYTIGPAATYSSPSENIENIALLDSATAWQSSYYRDAALADKAIDNETNGDRPLKLSVSHTAQQTDPSWHVTWPAAYLISRIKVWNRTDSSYGSRIIGFVLNIYLDGNIMWSSAESTVSTSSEEVMYDFKDIPSHIAGDKVEVQLPGNSKILQLAEVQVFGYSAVVATSPSNIPSSAIATQTVNTPGVYNAMLTPRLKSLTGWSRSENTFSVGNSNALDWFRPVFSRGNVANVPRSLRSDIVMRERGRGASVRTSGSSGSSISNQLVIAGIGGAPSSSGGSPIVASTASKARAGATKKVLRAVADKTVSDFFRGLVGPEKIQKHCIVVLTPRALEKPSGELYRYNKLYVVTDHPHIVTCDPYTKKDPKKDPYTSKKDKKFVTMKVVEKGTDRNGNEVVVDVTDLELIGVAAHPSYPLVPHHQINKEVLRKLGIFPNEGFKKERNMQFSENPEKWGMTLRQFSDYIKFCREGVISVKVNVNEKGKVEYRKITTVAQSTIWNKLKIPNEHDSEKDWVNAHDLNEAYIMKHTQGTGMGVALNMQKSPMYGNVAVVMLSHAWNEDMSQLLLMLEEAKNNKLKLQSGEEFTDNTVLWFCCFAQFQVNTAKKETWELDRLGPTLAEQMEKDPFEKVIRSKLCKDMIILQTTAYDPNTRFWCVLELYEALKPEKKEDFKLHYLFSKKFLKTYVQREKVPAVKRWEQNKDPNQKDLWSLCGASDGGSSTNVVIHPDGAIFNDTIPRYKLMKVNDTETLTDKHINNTHADKHTWDFNTLNLDPIKEATLNFKSGQIWSKLKYDIFMSKREGDGWESKFITVGNDDKWKEMQKTIVEFQTKSALDAMKKHLDTKFMYW